jgi:hypothetical protein
MFGVCKEGVRAGLEKRKLGRVSEEAPSFALQQSWVTCSNPADGNPESTMQLIAVTVILLVKQKGTEIYRPVANLAVAVVLYSGKLALWPLHLHSHHPTPIGSAQ